MNKYITTYSCRMNGKFQNNIIETNAINGEEAHALVSEILENDKSISSYKIISTEKFIKEDEQLHSH